MVLGLSLAASVAACGGGDDPGDEPAPVDPESREAADIPDGKLAVERRKCESCHTTDKGTMAGSATILPGQPDGIELYPPNLTPDEETGIGAWTDEELALAIRRGVDNESLQLCPQMKHFAEMTDFEVYSIVMYLRSLPPVKNAVPRSVCPPLKTKDEQ